MTDSTKFRQWEHDLIWLWDQMLDAERGHILTPANTLALVAVEAVKAHIADAAPSGHSRRAGASTRPAGD